MQFNEWKSLWRLDRDIQVPHASVVVMCPYGFVRVLWHYCPKEFKAWPSTYETGVVLGWRWPWSEKFREKAWLRKDEMPLAVYGRPMDEIYLARAVKDLLMVDDTFPIERVTFVGADSPIRHIGPTVKVLLDEWPRCSHNLWLANCPQCARKALRLAIRLKAMYEPVRQIDPHEDPVVAFRRREEEAKKRLGVGQ